MIVEVLEILGVLEYEGKKRGFLYGNGTGDRERPGHDLYGKIRHVKRVEGANKQFLKDFGVKEGLLARRVTSPDH